MLPLYILLFFLLAVLAVSIRMAGAEKRRRRRGWAAYYDRSE